jgi:hypothetical protein
MHSYQCSIIKRLPKTTNQTVNLLYVLMQFLRKYLKARPFMSAAAVPVENDDYCVWRGNTREVPCLRKYLRFHPVKVR